MISKLTELSEAKAEAKLRSFSRESFTWLQAKIKEIKNPAAIPATIKAETSRNTRRFILGQLYMFYYDPKGKMDMPYYDRFPLVIALEKYGDGFLGLNLHYLPIKYRILFMNKLMRYAKYTPENEIQKLRISYEILSASRRFKEFKPCLKRYLHGHIRSRILTVEPEEWDVAVALPIQLFKGATSQHIWQESTNEIRQSNNTWPDQ